MLAHTLRLALVVLLIPLASQAATQAGPAAIQGREGWLFPAWELGTVADAQPAVQLIGQTREVLERRGIHLVVALTPSKVRIYPEYLPANLRLPAGFEISLARQVTALREAGVEVVDLSGPMLAAKPRPQFLRTDSHWSVDAATAAARAVASRVRATGWIADLPKSDNPPLPRLREMHHVGDLVPLLPAIPGSRPDKMAETIQIFREPDELALLDDAGPLADVVVIGSSFAEPKWGFPRALGAALERPVGLLYGVGSYGYWYTLLDYLHGADFRATRPRLLVWQITETALPNLPDSVTWKRNATLLPAGDWLRQVEQALR